MPLIRVSKRMGGVRMQRSRGKARRKMISYPISGAGRQYLKSILNPSFGGAKIPDSFGAKTCTIQLQRERKIDLVSGQTTLGGLLQVSIAPLSWVYDAANNAWVVDSLIDGSSTYQPYGSVAGSKLPTLFRSGRVVSAGFKIQYVGTTQNDQGTLTVFGVDRSHLASAVGATGGAFIGNPDFVQFATGVDPIGPTLSSTLGGGLLRNLPINAFGPVRQGGTARYFPIDDSDLAFHPYPSQVTGSAQDVLNCRVGSVAALGFFAEGLGNGGSVIVQYTVNLECTVRDDSFHLVSSESSPVDSKALARCAMVYLKKPQVSVGSVRGDTESINVYNR